MDDREMLDVRAFHTRYEMLVNDAPTHVTQKKLVQQLKIMFKELYNFDKATQKQDMVVMASMLVELVHAAKSTAVMMGLPWRALWDDACGVNMSDDVSYRTAAILGQAGYDRAAFTHPSAPDVIDERFCDDDRATRLVP